MKSCEVTIEAGDEETEETLMVRVTAREDSSNLILEVINPRTHAVRVQMRINAAEALDLQNALYAASQHAAAE